MKIRSGFVSNSSSSSFVIRGAKFKIDDIAKRLGINPNTSDLYEELTCKFTYGNGKVGIKSTRYYFDTNSGNKEDVIVGVRIADLDDGVVSVIPDVDDIKVKQKIENKIGPINQKLKTYIQFVSNDNF